MKRLHSFFLSSAIACSLAAAWLAGCGKNPESEFQKGLDAYSAHDYAKATEHYRIAADMGYADAQYQLGWCYAKAEGVPRNWDEAFRWWGKAAGQGHPDARDRMNALRRIEALRKTAEHGIADAQHELGRAYQFAQNVDADLSEAAKWYTLAADQDHTGALYMLGHLYFDGSGVVADREKAFGLWRRGAELEDADAMRQLGECYEEGDGVPEDHAEAAEWYRLAAGHGNEYAQTRLDAMLAAEKALPAAEQGDAEAQAALGDYYSGRQSEESNAAAVKWYSLAAGQGHSEAQYQLARHYDHGWGVEEDKAEAVKWFRLAAGQGNREAQVELAQHYRNGEGVEKDPEEADRWMVMDVQSEVLPDLLYRRGMQYAKRGRPGDMEEAVRSWRKAAGWSTASGKAGPAVAAAQYQLGRCCYYGIGLPEDKAAGLDWFRKAAANGDPDAKEMLDALDGGKADAGVDAQKP